MKLNAKQVAEVLAGYEDMIRAKIADDLFGVSTFALRGPDQQLSTYIKLEEAQIAIQIGSTRNET